MGNANLTLYAQWKINNVTVTLNGNGGKFGTATAKTVTGNYGTELTGASGYAQPSKPGYVYEWNKAKPQVYPNPGEVLIVDALWTPIKVKVLFKVSGEGGSVSPTEVMVDAGTAIGITPTLTPQNTGTMTYTPTNVWNISEGGQVTTEGIATYLISGKNPEVTFTTGFTGEEVVDRNTDPVGKDEKAVDKIITGQINDNDIKGSTFSLLQAKGKCYIYAYGQNGVFKKIKLTVK